MFTDEIKKLILKIVGVIVAVIIGLYILANFIAFALFNFFNGTGGVVIPTGESVLKSTSIVNTIQTSITPTSIDELSRPLLRFRGIIRSDPEHAKEIELGDTWYWVYFNEPYLLEGSAVGQPIYVEKLQIVDIPRGLRINNESLEDFLDQRVEVAGHLGWGYAESVIIEPIAITTLE